LKKNFTKAVQALIPDIKEEHLLPSNKVGIRAQLLNTRTRQLEMDFFVERKNNTIHILNAVSPAFTSSLKFAELLVNNKI
jgi:L-2-hydroxyglutarate oxidase LhgO